MGLAQLGLEREIPKEVYKRTIKLFHQVLPQVCQELDPLGITGRLHQTVTRSQAEVRVMALETTTSGARGGEDFSAFETMLVGSCLSTVCSHS